MTDLIGFPLLDPIQSNNVSPEPLAPCAPDPANSGRECFERDFERSQVLCPSLHFVLSQEKQH